jgi:hypothetical protein
MNHVRLVGATDSRVPRFGGVFLHSPNLTEATAQQVSNAGSLQHLAQVSWQRTAGAPRLRSSNAAASDFIDVGMWDYGIMAGA